MPPHLDAFGMRGELVVLFFGRPGLSGTALLEPDGRSGVIAEVVRKRERLRGSEG